MSGRTGPAEPPPRARPRQGRPVRPGRPAAEVSPTLLTAEIAAQLGVHLVVGTDDTGALAVSIPTGVEVDEAALKAVVDAHQAPVQVPDPLEALGAAVEPARTIADLRAALLDYVKAEQDARAKKSDRVSRVKEARK